MRMKKKTAVLFAAFCFFASFTVSAQYDLRLWQTGDLTWNDFRVVDTNTVKEHSYIEFYLDIEENEEYELGTSWVELVATAYMDKKLSWVDKKHCTAEELRYNQVIFDLVELFRRRLQVVIDTGGNADIDYYIRLLEHVTDSFCRDTRYGANTLAVVAWETKVGKQLDSIAPIVMQKHATSHPSKRNYMPRAWEKGPLGWNNFTLVTESIGEEHSYLEYSLDIENRKYENDGVTWWGKTAVANMDKNSTWVDKNHCTAAELRYNQVLFNIVELYRRYLQVDIDTCGHADRDYYMQLLGNETSRYCRETRYGADTAAVDWWDQQVRLMMDSITPYMVEKHASVLVVPELYPTFHFGSSIGGGAKIYAGEIHNLFAPSGGFVWYFEGGYQRHIFTLGLYLGGGRCLPEKIPAVKEDNTLLGTDEISTLDLHLDYGFAVINSRHFRMAPFVGYGLQGVYYNEIGNEIGGGPTEGCWRAGVDFKYHLLNEITVSKSAFEQYLLSVEGKVFVSRDNFISIVGAPKGYTINISLGFAMQYKEGKTL